MAMVVLITTVQAAVLAATAHSTEHLSAMAAASARQAVVQVAIPTQQGQAQAAAAAGVPVVLHGAMAPCAVTQAAQVEQVAAQ